MNIELKEGENKRVFKSRKQVKQHLDTKKGYTLTRQDLIFNINFTYFNPMDYLFTDEDYSTIRLNPMGDVENIVISDKSLRFKLKDSKVISNNIEGKIQEIINYVYENNFEKKYTHTVYSKKDPEYMNKDKLSIGLDTRYTSEEILYYETDVLEYLKSTRNIFDMLNIHTHNKEKTLYICKNDGEHFKGTINSKNNLESIIPIINQIIDEDISQEDFEKHLYAKVENNIELDQNI